MKKKKRNERYFDNIEIFTSLKDCIKYNWDELHTTNDLTWLIKTNEQRRQLSQFIEEIKDIEEGEITKEIENKAKQASEVLITLEDRFFSLMDEWWVLTNSASNRKEMWAIMRKLIIARDKVINGDEFQKLWVRKYEEMLNDMSEDVGEYNATKERVQLSIALKMPIIDPKEITVLEYHYLMEEAIEMMKQKDAADG